MAWRENISLDCQLQTDHEYFCHFLEYKARHSYIGAALGRITERLKGSCFAIDGVEYNVSANEGQNQVHGGFSGFDSVSQIFWFNGEMSESVL
jgi:galactose mutarotase-like enzyme